MMKLEFTMDETEEGRVETRVCPENPHQNTSREGIAYLNRDGSGEVICNCGVVYPVSWSAEYHPDRLSEKRFAVSILPADDVDPRSGKDLGTVLFQNYKPSGSRK